MPTRYGFCYANKIWILLCQQDMEYHYVPYHMNNIWDCFYWKPQSIRLYHIMCQTWCTVFIVITVIIHMYTTCTISPPAFKWHWLKLESKIGDFLKLCYIPIVKSRVKMTRYIVQMCQKAAVIFHSCQTTQCHITWYIYCVMIITHSSAMLMSIQFWFMCS